MSDEKTQKEKGAAKENSNTKSTVNNTKTNQPHNKPIDKKNSFNVEELLKESIFKIGKPQQQGQQDQQGEQEENEHREQKLDISYYPSPFVQNDINRCIYRKNNQSRDKNGDPVEESITNFIFEFIREIKFLDEKDKNKVEYETNIILSNGEKRPFTFDNEALNNPREFGKRLDAVHSSITFRNITEVMQAFRDLKKFSETLYKTTRFGWYTWREIYEKTNQKILNENDPLLDEPVYLTKSTIIDQDGIHKNDKIIVDIPKTFKASNVDIPLPDYLLDENTLKEIYQDNIPDEDTRRQLYESNFKRVGEHIRQDLMNLHDPYFMRMALADVFGSEAIFLMEMDGINEIRYKSFYVGEGSKGSQGKTYVLKTLANFKGNFFGKGKIITWAGKIPGIEEQMGYMRHTLSLVEDFKKSYIGVFYKQGDIIGLIHNYVEGSQKPRNTRSGYDSPILDTYFISSGENIFANDVSDEGRIRTITVPQIDLKLEIGKKCEDNIHLYPIFTGEYIRWLLNNQSDFVTLYNNFQHKLQKEFQIKDIRKSKMYAISYLWYDKFCQFMFSKGFMTEEDAKKELKEFWQQIVEQGKEAAEIITSKDPANVFKETIMSLRAGGKILFLEKEPNKTAPIKLSPIPTVGYVSKEENIVYINPEVSLNVVKQNVREFPANREELSITFEKNNWLAKMTNKRYCNLTMEDGHKVPMWAFKSYLFGYDAKESLEDNPLKFKMIAHMLDSVITNMKVETQPTIEQHEKIISETLSKIVDCPEWDKKQRERKEKLYTEFIKTVVEIYYLGRKWSVPVMDISKGNLPPPGSKPVNVGSEHIFI